MLEFARWKYVVIAIVLLFTALYSMPNLYPKDPSVQISANRNAPVDAALVTRVDTLLKASKVPTRSVAIEGKNLIVRLDSVERQTTAANLLRPELGVGYTVALN